MQCDYCQNEATVHLTKVINGEVQKLHFCADCAKKHQVLPGKTFSVSDVLMNEVPSPKRGRDLVCPSCGMTLTRFKKGGRLGCEVCYQALHDALLPVLKGMHYAVRHAGRFPRRAYHARSVQAELEELRRELGNAVDAENFEAAAGLRDRIATLQDDAGRAE